MFAVDEFWVATQKLPIVLGWFVPRFGKPPQVLRIQPLVLVITVADVLVTQLAKHRCIERTIRYATVNVMKL